MWFVRDCSAAAADRPRFSQEKTGDWPEKTAKIVPFGRRP
jgi:hypothetical protein